MSGTRYVVGIDLGTTNCAVVGCDTGQGPDAPRRLTPVPQVVQPGTVEERPLLPSFLLLPGPGELPAGSLKLPWAADRDFAAGEFARNFGGQVPTRLVSSAKSWLCHPGVDRRGPVLPWRAPETTRRLSPLEACTLYLRHLAESWDHTVAKGVDANRLGRQEVVLTVPASFDAIARDLTAEAAKQAGLDHVTLLEEPQAAFYAWLDALGDGWRDQVGVGDLVLVADVGGGTTDFTLIEVTDERGRLALERLAVGDHVLLGGDNMDLALAHAAAAAFAQQKVKLDAGQMMALTHACRQAKEKLLADPNLEKLPVTVPGRGSKVIGGTLKTELSRADVERVLVDGFFPRCEAGAEPQRPRGAGLQELGLAYAADPAVTRHLAHFLHRHADAVRKAGRTGPTAILFNGGVFKSPALRDRLREVIASWSPAGPPRVLTGTDLDTAVARGAAYYGLVRRGQGVRIRGGTARAYYIGVEVPTPAVPGAAPPIKALCVAPFGMEEGSEADVPGQEFGLVVGEPAEFRFLGSSVRRDDGPGAVVEDWDGDEIEELTPVTATMQGDGGGRTVPVHLFSKVTEVGQLELWCISRDGSRRWKLEYNVRERRGGS